MPVAMNSLRHELLFYVNQDSFLASECSFSISEGDSYTGFNLMFRHNKHHCWITYRLSYTLATRAIQTYMTFDQDMIFKKLMKNISLQLQAEINKVQGDITRW